MIGHNTDAQRPGWRHFNSCVTGKPNKQGAKYSVTMASILQGLEAADCVFANADCFYNKNAADRLEIQLLETRVSTQDTHNKNSLNSGTTLLTNKQHIIFA